MLCCALFHLEYITKLESCYIVLASLKLLPPKCWAYRIYLLTSGKHAVPSLMTGEKELKPLSAVHSSEGCPSELVL